MPPQATFVGRALAGDDVQRATQLALELFSKVYRLPSDFLLAVEER